ALQERTLDSSIPLDFRTLYDQWFDPVGRWLRAFGIPDSEIDDVAQEVFLVVQRKLAGFDGANLPGWLYQISARPASDHRRRAWFRRLSLWRGRIAAGCVPAPSPGPAELLEEKEARQCLHGLLLKMSEKRRTAFVLYELEGYSGEEIAELLGIPVAT